MNKIKRIKGTQDILPGQSENWQFLESVLRSQMRKFNYNEIRTPVFEQTELFARGIGEVTDIVSKEMYTFEDRGKKSLTLKPEMTAPVIRAFIEHNLVTKFPLNKIYYIAPLFRQENPQAGRLRQFHQFGAEAIGSASPEIDFELILLAMDTYQQLGLKNLVLKMNSVGTPEDRENYKSLLKEFIEPNLSKYCPDCQKRYETNILRVLDCKITTCSQLNKNAPRLMDSLCEASQDHFNTVSELLKVQNIDFVLDPYLVRGLDYYTHTVFEITSGSLGSQDAICGGGRYDLLSKQLGGPDVPAVGFASGMERLLMVLEAQQLISESVPKLDIFIAPLDSAASLTTNKWLYQFRNAGYRCDRDYMGRSLKSQMREANRQNARLVLLLGEEELKNSMFSVKDMLNSTQENVKFGEIENYIDNFFRSVNE